MAAIEALANAYGDDSDSEGNESPEEETTADHTAHLNSNVSISQLQSKVQVKSAPVVTAKVGNESVRWIWWILRASQDARISDGL